MFVIFHPQYLSWHMRTNGQILNSLLISKYVPPTKIHTEVEKFHSFLISLITVLLSWWGKCKKEGCDRIRKVCVSRWWYLGVFKSFCDMLCTKLLLLEILLVYYWDNVLQEKGFAKVLKFKVFFMINFYANFKLIKLYDEKKITW